MSPLAPRRLFTAPLKAALRSLGYIVVPLRPLGPWPEDLRRREFDEMALAIQRRHEQQTLATATALKTKYSRPVFGKVKVWDLMERLALCVDPVDRHLYCASQYVHVAQILDRMERDGVCDEDLLVAAMVHDIGKLLLLTGEAPENVVCVNRPLGTYAPGVGLDNCVFQWNHDEFAYSRLKDYVPDHISWLIRYHSVRLDRYADLMDERDREYAARYHRQFSAYDYGTKSAHGLPRTSPARYRSLVEKYFPHEIWF